MKSKWESLEPLYSLFKWCKNPSVHNIVSISFATNNKFHKSNFKKTSQQETPNSHPLTLDA